MNIYAWIALVFIVFVIASGLVLALGLCRASAWQADMEAIDEGQSFSGEYGQEEQ